MTIFLFNGHDMTQYVEVAKVEAPALPSVNVTTQEIAGRDGAAFIGSTLAPLELVVHARLVTGTIEPAEIQRQWALVAAMLRTAEPAELSLVPGVYYMAMLQGESPLEFATYSATGELRFLCSDPVAYGEAREVTVPSGGSVEFMVGGTHRALPKITAGSARRNSSSLVWGIRLDEGDFIHVATGSASARKLELDCSERTCSVAGAATLPTLDSDWLELEPGEHVLRNDQGSGACTVTWRERWL